jgi:hypothetical protein
VWTRTVAEYWATATNTRNRLWHGTKRAKTDTTQTNPSLGSGIRLPTEVYAPSNCHICRPQAQASEPQQKLLALSCCQRVINLGSTTLMLSQRWWWRFSPLGYGVAVLTGTLSPKVLGTLLSPSSESVPSTQSGNSRFELNAHHQIFRKLSKY